MIHKQNRRNLWRFNARRWQAARRRMRDPEWCRQAEERWEQMWKAEHTHTEPTLTTDWNVYRDQAAAWYSDPITREWDTTEEDAAWAEL